MTRHRSPSFEPEPAGGPGLDRLLEAAAGPAHPQELAGESAAQAAFRTHYQAAPAQGPPAVTAPAARLRSVRVATRLAAVLAVIMLGSTAYAAESGHLPAAVQRRVHDLFANLGVPGPAPRPATSAGHADGAAGVTPSVGPDRPGVDGAANLVGLCRSWLGLDGNGGHAGGNGTGAGSGNAGGNGAGSGNAGGNGAGATGTGPDQRLVAAAGGASYIDAYCVALLAGAPVPAPSPVASPSPTDQQGPHPHPSHTHPPHGRPPVG